MCHVCHVSPHLAVVHVPDFDGPLGGAGEEHRGDEVVPLDVVDGRGVGAVAGQVGGGVLGGHQVDVALVCAHCRQPHAHTRSHNKSHDGPGCGSIRHFPDTPAQSELQSENCEYSQYQNIHNFALKFTLRRRVGEMMYAPTARAIMKVSG